MLVKFLGGSAREVALRPFANLVGADLRGANLRGANLEGASLEGASLWGANLRGANLRGAKNIPPLAAAQTSITPEGALIGWKKCHDGVLVKLRIPEAARRSNATGRKCRAEFVEVLEVIGAAVGVSQYSSDVTYTVGATVRADAWCEDRWQECAGGIHFFLTREEAEAY